jgi:diguanylate cyclase (GGDEF)-like protein/putative nucleotidyltransferase with HDIG domain
MWTSVSPCVEHARAPRATQGTRLCRPNTTLRWPPRRESGDGGTTLRTLPSAPDPIVMGRSLGYLFAVTATIELLSLLFFDLAPEDQLRIVALSFAAWGVVALLLFAFDRLPAWSFYGIVACGTLLISASIYYSGQSPSAYTFFYLWVALYAWYFFSPRQAAAQLAFVGLAYGIVLAARHQTFPRAANWLITMATLAVAGVVIRQLKSDLEQLVASLAEAARSDGLTGLLNRRALNRALHIELDRAQRNDNPLTLLVADLDHLRRVNARGGQEVGDDVLQRVGTIIGASTRFIDASARLSGGEFGMVLPDTDVFGARVVADRVRDAVREKFADEPVPVTISFGLASFPTHADTADDLMQAGERALYAAKVLGRDRSVVHSTAVAGILTEPAGDEVASETNLATLVTLAEALDIRDSGTAQHANTVGRYAEMMARELALPAASIERVRLAGILHDVGKIGVIDSILRKPSELDEEEWGEMRKHPEIGARILQSANIDDIREWVLAHHERPDGLGYPRRLKGEEIPIEARILAVADAYEAMLADRPYRAGIGHRAAREELRVNSGTQFDARVVDVFLIVLDRTGEGGDDLDAVRREVAGGNGEGEGEGEARASRTA